MKTKPKKKASKRPPKKAAKRKPAKSRNGKKAVKRLKAAGVKSIAAEKSQTKGSIRPIVIKGQNPFGGLNSVPANKWCNTTLNGQPCRIKRTAKGVQIEAR